MNKRNSDFGEEVIPVDFVFIIQHSAFSVSEVCPCPAAADMVDISG